MTAIDEALQANRQYAQCFVLGDLPAPPARALAVIACMDARVSLQEMLGLRPGDAHIIRNAGGIVTADALRSLIVSHHLLGTREIMIINHTDCGMLTFRDEDLQGRLRRETGAAAVTPATFHTFTDITQNVRLQAERIGSHPWMPTHIVVRGFVYDVHTGHLNEVPVRTGSST